MGTGVRLRRTKAYVAAAAMITRQVATQSGTLIRRLATISGASAAAETDSAGRLQLETCEPFRVGAECRREDLEGDVAIQPRIARERLRPSPRAEWVPEFRTGLVEFPWADSS